MPIGSSPRAGEGGAAYVFGDFAGRYAFARVVTSARKTYRENWRRSVSWRVHTEKGIWSDAGMEGDGDGRRASIIHGVYAAR